MSRICIEGKCNTRASFGLITDIKPSYCKKHKKEAMVNIVSKRCKEEGCDKYPSFGLPTDKSPTYCVEHKKEGMINIKNKN